jgi:hypothetical protein
VGNGFKKMGLKNLSILILLGMILIATRLDAQKLLIESPLDYQVFQRQTRLRGIVKIRGFAPYEVDHISVRISGHSARDTPFRRWQKLRLKHLSEEFECEVEVAAGGFYRIDLELKRGRHIVATSTVSHVGVGEVFVVSGQSNSTNYGEVPQRVQTGMVVTFDGDSWRIANDPQPGTQDNSKKGSFVPAFGDALYQRYGVPIGIASVGHGSTSVRQWLPAGQPVEVMPTMTKYITQDDKGTLISDGPLFNGMMKRIHELGPHGFRAVLWHQGESDSHQPSEHEIDGQTYRRMLEQVITSSRKEAGWDVPWFVAQASYHTSEDPSTPEIRQAQESLWKSGMAIQGPDTDTLTAFYRQNNGRGTHFNDAGLKAHGLLWARAVEVWLDKVLR